MYDLWFMIDSIFLEKFLCASIMYTQTAQIYYVIIIM